MQKESGSAERNILIIEDEEIVRQMVAMILEQEGFCVLQAGDADEAERLWHANRDSIALLITDVEIPGRRGPDMAREFKSEKPGLRIIISTGSVDLPIESIADLASERDVLEKPYTPKKLLDAVRRTLANQRP